MVNRVAQMTIQLSSPGGGGRAGVGRDGTGLIPFPNHHVRYDRGLSSEEIFRIDLDPDEKLQLFRLSMSLKGQNTLPSGLVFTITDEEINDAVTSIGGVNPGQRKGTGSDPFASTELGATVTGNLTITTIDPLTVNITGIARIVRE